MSRSEPLPGGVRSAQRQTQYPYLQLFLIGVATLFVELALIRWLGTEVRVFAYFKNLTLIACFFGGGLGCVVGAKLRWPRVVFYPSLLLIVAVVVVPKLVVWDLVGATNRFLAVLNDMPLWAWGAQRLTALSILLGLGFLIGVFFLIALVFAPLGGLLGDRLQRAPNLLRGYSANVAGSLVGVGLFDLFSYSSLPPVAWFVASCLLGSILLHRRDLPVAFASTTSLSVVLLLHSSPGTVTVWSPYQKLTLIPERAVAASGESS